MSIPYVTTDLGHPVESMLAVWKLQFFNSVKRNVVRGTDMYRKMKICTIIVFLLLP